LRHIAIIPFTWARIAEKRDYSLSAKKEAPKAAPKAEAKKEEAPKADA
jgi:hypothetical protein